MRRLWQWLPRAAKTPEDRAAYWQGRAKTLDSELRATRKQLDNLLAILADLKKDGLVMPSQMPAPRITERKPLPPAVLAALRSRVSEDSPTWDSMHEEAELRLASEQAEEEVIRWIRRGRSIREFGVG